MIGTPPSAGGVRWYVRTVTDATTAAESTESGDRSALVGWRRRRDIAGQVLQFGGQLLRPDGGDEPPGRVRQAVALAASFLPHSIDSRRSIWSVRSMYSAGSVTSLGSFGSLASAGSAGSILSIGSAGSILSIGSVGSILSIGSAGSVLAIGGFGQHPGRWSASSSEAGATVRHLGTVAGALAVAGAVTGALRSS
jgi:hypothetical protein